MGHPPASDEGRQQGRKEVREQVVTVPVGHRLPTPPVELGDHLAALTDETWQVLLHQLPTITSVEELESFLSASRPAHR